MRLEENLTIILPTLNEEENIVPQIKELLGVFPNLRKAFVVDDNSQDNTIKNVKAAFPDRIEKGQIQILVRTHNLGLTPSLEQALGLITTDLVGWMDCDLSMPCEKFKEMLKKIEAGFDICVGSRFLPGGGQKNSAQIQKDSKIAVYASSQLNHFFRFFKKFPVTDLTSGFIIAKRHTLLPLKWEGRHGEYFMSLMSQAHRQGAKITEIPYTCGTRKYGESKTFGTFKAKLLNPGRYLKAMVKVLFFR